MYTQTHTHAAVKARLYTKSFVVLSFVNFRQTLHDVVFSDPLAILFLMSAEDIVADSPLDLYSNMNCLEMFCNK